MLLEVKNLTKRFGGMTAVSKVDLSVKQGEVRGIIGPNGSGKSTLFNLISGVYRPEPGASIVFDGENITNWESHEIARRGIARVPSSCCGFFRHERAGEHADRHHSLMRYGSAPGRRRIAQGMGRGAARAARR
jgi:ABC-type branched-subunit amino acid transport system ATPase component